MKRFTQSILFILLPVMNAFATHQRAAEITYKHISGLTYEAKIITYTYTPSPADRPELTLNWGDGTSSILIRTQKTDLPDNISLNVYEYNLSLGATSNRHTYSSPGTYILSMEDPNRNYGVINIPNSVNVPMYVQTVLVINPFLGYNNSPVLLNPPIDVGCVNQLYVHNPGAYDEDGDSLSYRLVICKTVGGIDIPGYSFPTASNSFIINEFTGDVTWDSPVMQGEYNIAFIIEEWRSGALIGNVTRDMQIEIVACDNNPPVIQSVTDTCVTAGDEIIFGVSAYDPDGDDVLLNATGGPFELPDNPAYIDPDPAAGSDTVSTTFYWSTQCNNVQKQPFQVFFKATDAGFPINLVAFRTINISVVSPAPENLTAEALGSTVRLNWNKAACSKSAGYRIYRRSGYYGFIPGQCETGVPAYTGYQLIHQNEGIEDTTFLDDNNGLGLIQGIDYCYMVTAYFRDGAESYASLEACATLKRDVPVITNVSNDSANLFAGNVFVAWSRPTELDTLMYPGPFIYNIMRADGVTGSVYQPIGTNNGLDDTLFFDTGIDLNGSTAGYRYRIDLESLSVGFIGSSQPASSILLTLQETDEEIRLSFDPVVPWLNDYYVIYRMSPGQSNYDSIGFSTGTFYRDTLLANDLEYCYYVKSVGKYTATGFVDPIINFSQLACGTPVDNEPPCIPLVRVQTNCEMAFNIVSWNKPGIDCPNDVAKYIIYFTPQQGGELIAIDSVLTPQDTVYSHFNNGSITGCYAVSAVDSAGNMSEPSEMVCISHDVCDTYSLPNVFTPNSDGYNDLFHPYPYTSVEKVSIMIFNRWGTLVYETEDPDINWDGKDMNTKAECSQGTYFYTGEVYEITLFGIRPREIRGSVMLLR